MVISRTPFRISFFGGGTDYPAWYKKHGGSILATTINKYCYLNARYMPPFFGYKYRIAYSKVENCKTIDQILHPSVREVIRFLKIRQGVEIHYDGDLPGRSGLGSSSAFTVGLLHALYALGGHMPNKHRLAKESIYLEQRVLKETVGSQDQVLASYGGFNLITFHKDGNFSLKPITIPSKRVEDLENHLMLFYTGIARTASDVAKTFIPNIEQKEKQLFAMNEMVNQALNILNSKQDINDFGKLLHETWSLKRSLSSSVSNSLIDDIYLNALSAGATGGKIIGAGGGGFILLFVPPSHQAKVRKKFNKLIHVPFNFERAGSQIIFFDQQEDYSLKK
ncbi:MAG: putative kinase related to galactokinase and mevalonate kinase [Microgenomates group bacterium Gr01-1014_7]|nr:MAG: putative kinase related to galactokinase and mevalonate kinase [Microgenomates group bacterium Gr01-1014_7]